MPPNPKYIMAKTEALLVDIDGKMTQLIDLQIQILAAIKSLPTGTQPPAPTEPVTAIYSMPPTVKPPQIQ